MNNATNKKGKKNYSNWNWNRKFEIYVEGNRTARYKTKMMMSDMMMCIFFPVAAIIRNLYLVGLGVILRIILQRKLLTYPIPGLITLPCIYFTIEQRKPTPKKKKTL